MPTEHLVPRVGVSALILKPDGNILTGMRIGSHGAGTIQVPGGHLEFGENPFACAKRETLEETGLEVRAIGQVATTNDVFKEAKKHYITIFVLCEM
ncbi:7,8-dihydro-8-oxoguanine triphosphatase, partial [Fusarium oxysporum f. sp. conglutinans race 2 54008]